MNADERLAAAQKKMEQYEHWKILQKNRDDMAKAKIDLRRKILLGEIFLKYFPIALKFTPGKSSEENAQIFESLDDFMKSLSECQQSFQMMEDMLRQPH